MSADIFIPKSHPKDATVAPLHTITYVTADKHGIEKALCEGLDMEQSAWLESTPDMNTYFGFQGHERLEYCSFFRKGEFANIQLLVILVNEKKPQIRPQADGRYFGGATIGFPMSDMPARENKMNNAGVKSTVGIKELEFTNTEGQTYISREIHFLGLENIFLLGVQRPDIFVQVGKIDPATQIGAPAYSARCVANLDEVNQFTEQVLGYEIRRDMQMSIGAKSGLLMEEGIPERFAQAFAPGAGSGYLVYLEHGGHGISNPTELLGAPGRGITRWSFPTENFEHVFQQATKFGSDIIKPPAKRALPHIGECRTMVLSDPSGFAIEIFAV